ARSPTVVAGDGWHPGVVGIVAARLAERFHRPALVIALDGGRGRGSGRSVRSVDLHGSVARCADLLETFGGHRQAVGFTIRRERIPVLAARFDAGSASTSSSPRGASAGRAPSASSSRYCLCAARPPTTAVKARRSFRNPPFLDGRRGPCYQNGVPRRRHARYGR